MATVSYEPFLDDSFSPEEWVQARTFSLTCARHFLLINSLIVCLQTVLEQAAASAAPETFIQTVLTKLSLLSNDANASLDAAAHTLQVRQVALSV